MSLLKSKFNLCVLELPKSFKVTQGDAFNSMRLKKFIELTPSQDFGHGWVDMVDMFNSDFSMEDSVAVNAVVGGYRFDKKNVPAPLLNRLYKVRLKEREKEEGGRLEKDEKEILKEECRQQLILKALPTPKLVTWIWDIDNNQVYLDAKSAGVVDMFINLFTQTFKAPKISVKTFGLKEEEIGEFLDWIWKNTSNLDDTWIDQGVTLNADKNTFKFSGPTLEDFLEEIESMKKGKSIKSLNIGCTLQKEDYSITFGDKNLITGIESLAGIEHESAETAIIDNSDRIMSIISKIQNTVEQYQVAIGE